MSIRLKTVVLWRSLVGLAILMALLAVGVVMWYQDPTQRGYEQYHWQDTKYKDIRTKVVERTSNSYASTVEYPVTPNSDVNATLAAKINSYNDSFFRSAKACFGWGGKKCTQNTSYQIVRYANGYMSIAIVTVRDLGSVPIHETAYWTFDLTTGKAVTLRDVFSGYPVDGPARVVLYVKQAIHAKLIKSGVSTNMSRADAAVTPTRVDNFLAIDARTIRFDFSPGEVAPESVGQISVTLPTDNLQLYMQNDTARKVFAVIPIDIVPEYVSQTRTDVSPNCETAKCIALTFDDGPSMYTSRLLDVFRDKHVHASFFLIGQNIAKYPDAVKREALEGHTIGNHTWDHPYLTHLSSVRMRSEIATTNGAIERLTGIAPTFIRPPNGAIDTAVMQAIADERMTGMLWSVDTRDWADRNSTIIYNRVVAGAKPGSIVILHDVHRPSVEAVPGIVSTLQKRGYVFVSLDELLGPNPAPGKIIRATD